MTDSVIEAAWRDGVGPDDAAAFATPATDEERLFWAWIKLLAGVRVQPPAFAGTGPIAVVASAAELASARLARDPARLDAELARLETLLAGLDADDPKASAARAWADLALGQVAVMVGDLATARRRLGAVSEPGAPVGLRIAAMLELIAVAMNRLDVAPARTWARKALTCAELAKRPLGADRARMALGLLDYLAGEHGAARRTLAPQLERGDLVARLLLSGVESATRGMALLADGLRQATETGDVVSYMACILVGSRRYVEIGHDADALVTMSAGIVQLQPLAPELAAVLVAERDAWRDAWPAERWAVAESNAMKLLG